MQKQHSTLKRLFGLFTDVLHRPAKAGPLRTDQKLNVQRKVRRSPGAAVATVDFETKIKKIIKESASVLSGRINLIGIGAIKERMGDAWPRIADRVDTIVRHEIKKHIARDDAFMEWGASDYVIIFAHVTDEEAQLKCRLIAAAIAKTLLGDEKTCEIEVKSAFSRMDGNLTFEAAPAVDSLLRRLKAAHIQVEPRQSEKSTRGGSSETFGPNRAMRSPAPSDSIHRYHGRPAGAATADVADAPQSSFESDMVAPDDNAIAYAYRPLWKVSRNVIAAYLCAPSAPADQSIDQEERGENQSINSAQATLEADLCAARHVVDAIDRMLFRDIQALLVLPVHFETLGGASRRRRYLETLDELSPEARRLLGIQILNIPNGIGVSRMAELVGSLRPLCRSLLLSTALDVRVLSHLADCGVDAIGAEVERESRSEADLIAQMDRFYSVARRARCATFMLGLDTVSLAVAALGIGFHFIAGDAVGGIVETPESIQSFGLQDMYSRLLIS